MATNSKLNKLGKQVLNAVKDGCKCWNDIEICSYECGDRYATFDIKDGYSITSPVFSKILTICDAFEHINLCNVCCSFQARQSDGFAYPLIHVSVSLK